MAKLVAQTYGEALFQIAMEGNLSDVMLAEVESIGEILKQNPDFDKMMLHPKISKTEKQNIMKTVFDGKVTKEMIGFLELVLIKERYAELSEIFEYFVTKMKEVKKIGVAYVTTAMELTMEKKKIIEQKLLDTTNYLTMEMHFIVDPEIIGGMVIRIKDRVVDSSIRTKITEMRKELLQIQLG